jgi:RNA polymerase sigma-70 factor (ECF subfamily)
MRPRLNQPRPDSEETRALLDRAAAGDPNAPGDLLARHRDALRGFVDLHLDPAIRARVDGSDIVQEAHADMARQLADYLARRPMPFHLWARKTAYNRLLNARRDHRAARRDVRREAVAPDHSSLALAQSILDPDPSPSEAVSAREQAERVAAAVARLDDADREVLLMRQVEQLPYEEVACLLGVTTEAARQRYGRALIRLRKALAGLGLIEETP